DGQNGVYSTSAATFPNHSFNSANYFVDVQAGLNGTAAAPPVTTTSRAANTIGVARTSAVNATFSRQMDPNSLTTSTFTLKDPAGATVPATVAYNNGTQTAVLTPSAALAFGTTYTATVGTGARATDGMALAGSVTWSFTTAQAVAPQVTLTVPANSASDV